MRTSETEALLAVIDADWYGGKVGQEFSSPDAALDHYRRVGEKAGFWPNPIFDPVYYSETNKLNPGTSALAHFVAEGLDRRLNPCRLFELDWYEWQNPDYIHEGNGLLHYMRRGAQEWRDPSPWLDMTGLSRSLSGRMPPLDAVHALECGCLDLPNPSCLTAGAVDLARRQRAFFASIEVKRIKSAVRPVHGRNLLFVQAADRANFWSWFQPTAPRDYDLLVNCYHGEFPDALHGDHVFVQRGTKFTGIFNIWRNYADVLDLYDNVFLLDDDLVLKPGDVSVFFSIMSEHGLELAQPALSATSHSTWPVFKRAAAKGVRYVNGVEIMMPALSRSARDRWLPYFMISVSGFGLDLLPQMLALKAGVVDDVEVHHPKVIDQSGGSYYEFLRAHGINAKAELWRIAQSFKVERGFREVKPMSDRREAPVENPGVSTAVINRAAKSIRAKLGAHTMKNWIFDIGMHTGVDTAYYLSLGFNVVAVEANPSLVTEGQKRFAAEIAAGRLRIEGVGIHDTDCVLPFIVNDQVDEWSSFVPHLGQRAGVHHTVNVQCRPLSYFVGKYGMPYFIKVDVEGMDARVVRQLRECKDRPSFISSEDGGIDSLIALYEVGVRLYKFVNQLKSQERFGKSSSGSFGDDLPGEWLPTEEAFAFYLTHVRPPSSAPINGFWDIHGKF